VLIVGVSANKADGATAVTKTVSNTGQILIPEFAVVGNCSSGQTKGVANPYPSHIQLSQANGFRRGSRILDVDLTLRNYTHTFPDDVDVLLVHGTRNRTVMSDVGGSNDVTNVTLTLDDEATNGILPSDGQIVSGRFKPTNFNTFATDTFPAPAPTPNSIPSLSGFDGQKANGGWDLFVFDDSSGDCGRFAGGWSLTINAR